MEWLYENKEAMELVQKGLQQARDGELVDIRVKDAKDKVARLKRELAEAETELLHAYESRFPEGRFIIQRHNKTWRGDSNKFYSLYWEVKSGMNYQTKIGLTDEPRWALKEKPPAPGIYRMPIRFNLNRKTTQYNSLEKMIRAAEKFELPQQLIQVFIDKYNELADNK